MEDDSGGVLTKRQQSMLSLIGEAKKINNGAGDARGALAQRMIGSLPTEKKDEYKSSSHAEKEQFRIEWNDQEENTLKNKVVKHEWQKVDTTHGTYMSASRVFQEEGGTEADVEPTCRLLDKSLRMGYPFTLWNPGTERLDFLHTKQGFKEKLSKSWSMFKEIGDVDDADRVLSNEGQHAAASSTGKASASASATATGAAAPATGDQAAQRKDRSSRPGKRIGSSSPAASGKKPRGKDAVGTVAVPTVDDAKKVIALAVKTKTDLNNSVAAANSMLEEIEGNEEWDWAKGKKAEALKAAVDAIKGATTSFSRQIASLDVTALKNLYDEKMLVTLCKNYNATHGPLADTVF